MDKYINKFMDNFHEEIVVRHNKGLYTFLYILATFAMIVLALAAALFMAGIITGDEGGIGINWLFLGIFVFCAGGAFLLFWSRNFMKTDFEYSFTNGTVDIAKVLNNKTRKEMLSFKAKEIEIMAPIMTNGFERYQGKSDLKKVKAWLNRDKVKYFVVFRYNEIATLLIFEPSTTLVELIKKYNFKDVKID